jgi:hypothetical protein
LGDILASPNYPGFPIQAMINQRMALFAHLHVSRPAKREMMRLPIP